MEIQSLDLVFEVRPAGDSGAPWQELICAIDDQSEMDNEVTETRTRCGTFSGVQDPTLTYSGNAVSNSSPEPEQASFMEVRQWQNEKELLDFRYYNKANGTVTIGSVVSEQGSGRFTNSVSTGNSGEVVQFSWTFTPSGEVAIGDPIS